MGNPVDDHTGVEVDPDAVVEAMSRQIGLLTLENIKLSVALTNARQQIAAMQQDKGE